MKKFIIPLLLSFFFLASCNNTANNQLTNNCTIEGNVNNSDKNSNIPLIISICVNVAVVIIPIVFEFVKINKETKHYKYRKISEDTIKHESKIYSQFFELCLLDQSQKTELLDSIHKLQFYLKNEKLYISKNFLKTSREFLDYFKKLSQDYKNKDIKAEEDYLDSLSKLFYGRN